MKTFRCPKCSIEVRAVAGTVSHRCPKNGSKHTELEVAMATATDETVRRTAGGGRWRALALATLAAACVLAACTASSTIEVVAVPGQPSRYPAISADGRWATFLAGPDQASTLYLHDHTTGALTEVTSGTSVASISGDGRYLTFSSASRSLVPGDTNGHIDVFTWDHTAGTYTQITLGNGDSGATDPTDLSHAPDISADGQTVAFSSQATDLVPGGAPAGSLYTWERATGTIRLEHRSATDPSLSADGRYLSMMTAAGVVRRDRLTATEVLVAPGAAGSSSISADGQRIAFDAGGRRGTEAFVWDGATGTTVEAPAGDGGHEVRPEISGDGEHVVYQHQPIIDPHDPTTFAWDVCEWNLADDGLTRITQAPTGSSWSDLPTVSADGRAVAFFTANGSVAPGATANDAVAIWRSS